MSSVTFQPNDRDLAAANRAYFMSSLRTGRMMSRYALGCFLFGILAVSLVWGEPVGPIAVSFLGGVLFWTLILGLGLTLNYALIPHRVRRIFVQQKALHDEVAIQWNDEGISFGSGRGTSRFAWSDFVRLAENENAIVLLQSDVLFNFIPKRVLSAEEAASIMAHRG